MAGCLKSGNPKTFQDRVRNNFRSCKTCIGESHDNADSVRRDSSEKLVVARDPQVMLDENGVAKRTQP